MVLLSCGVGNKSKFNAGYIYIYTHTHILEMLDFQMTQENGSYFNGGMLKNLNVCVYLKKERKKKLLRESVECGKNKENHANFIFFEGLRCWLQFKQMLLVIP